MLDKICNECICDINVSATGFSNDRCFEKSFYDVTWITFMMSTVITLLICLFLSTSRTVLTSRIIMWVLIVFARSGRKLKFSLLWTIWRVDETSAAK